MNMLDGAPRTGHEQQPRRLECYPAAATRHAARDDLETCSVICYYFRKHHRRHTRTHMRSADWSQGQGRIPPGKMAAFWSAGSTGRQARARLQRDGQVAAKVVGAGLRQPDVLLQERPQVAADAVFQDEPQVVGRLVPAESQGFAIITVSQVAASRPLR